MSDSKKAPETSDDDVDQVSASVEDNEETKEPPKAEAELADSATDTSDDDTGEDAAEGADSQDAVSDPDAPEASEVDGEDVIEDAEVISETPAEGEDTSEDETPDPADDTAEPAEQVEDPAPVEPTAAAAPAVTEKRSGGFVPMVLGGVVAAALGAGGALFLFPNGLGQDLTELQRSVTSLTEKSQSQAKTTAQLQETLQGLQIPADPTAQLSDMTAQAAAVVDRLAATEAQITALSDRLSVLEKRPVTESVSPEAVAAYEKELTDLQAAMAAQRAEVEAMLAEAQTARSDAGAEAKQATIIDAVTRVSQAVNGGESFASALADLREQGVPVPDVLTQNADGIATQEQLITAFPAAARAALAATREEEDDTGVGGFLRTHLGVRSLTPQDGDSADAVLSRAEALVKSGQLQDAMTELQDLSATGQDAVASWTEQAKLRADALMALNALSQSVKSN